MVKNDKLANHIRTDDCCTIAGWGKTASDEQQLKTFIRKEAAYKQSHPSHVPFYTAETELFPTTPRMTFNFIQPSDVCFRQYGANFGLVYNFTVSHE